MKTILLLPLFLLATCASAQTEEKRIILRKLHHSGADAPSMAMQETAKRVSAGYLTVATEDPLTVSEDPAKSFINRATVSVDPAKKLLTIDFKEDIPKQRVTVAISYEDGQLLKSDSFFPQKSVQTVPLPELKSSSIYASRFNIAVYQADKLVLYWGQLVK